jgi:uncharacterized membrane protein
MDKLVIGIGIVMIIIPIILLIIGIVINDSSIRNIGIFIFILYTIVGSYMYISSKSWMIQHTFREIK